MVFTGRIEKLVGLYALLATAAWAVLLSRSLTLARRNEELQKEVKDHVDMHAISVNELEMQVNHCNKTNELLEAKSGDVIRQNAMLNASKGELVKLNAKLSSSLISFQDQNNILNASNAACIRSNGELHETKRDLDAQLNTLTKTTATMNETLQEYVRLIDRMADENERLERSNARLTERIYALNESNVECAELNVRLNESLADLQQREEELSASNSEYIRKNARLSQTSRDLAAQVTVLEAVNAELNATVVWFALLIDELSRNIDWLERLNDDLTESVRTLNASVAALTRENARLSELNDDLGAILSFLDEAAGDVRETYDSVAAYLADQIAVSRGLLIEGLANTYRQRTTCWICGARSRFAAEPFVPDPNSPIGSDAYHEVVEYLEEVLLGDMCLDPVDAERFVTAATGGGRFPPVDVTWNEFISAVTDYSIAAVDYYFPDPGEEGLEAADWADADYRCNNLPPNKQFRFISS